MYEFDADLFGHSKTKNHEDFPYPIQYPCNREYELFSYAKTGKKRNEQFVRLLTTKAVDWFCEEEVRFICLDKSGFAKKFNPDCLKSIIFGIRTPNDEISKIMDCCKKHNLNHITFKQAEFIRGKFEIELKELD